MGKQLNSVDKPHPFGFHDKMYHAAAGMAAKAIVHLLFRYNRKAGRFFIMERAARPIPSALWGKRNIFRDYSYNIRFRKELVKPFFRKSRHHTTLLSQNPADSTISPLKPDFLHRNQQIIQKITPTRAVQTCFRNPKLRIYRSCRLYNRQLPFQPHLLLYSS